MAESTTNTVREPTAEECTAHAPLGDGWFAIWYPQMGGYAGKAAVREVEHAPGGCLDFLVWHNGEFPFRGNDRCGLCDGGRSPAVLHHCDIDQFRQLADEVEALFEVD